LPVSDQGQIEEGRSPYREGSGPLKKLITISYTMMVKEELRLHEG
jgi:hypothetical protein